MFTDTNKPMIGTIVFVVIASLMLNSCAQPTPEPTNTPLPTNTPQPTNTPFPTDTPTPEPTATLEPTPTEKPAETEDSGLGLGGRLFNVQGGYTFRFPMVDYSFYSLETTNTIFRDDKEVVVYLGGSTAPVAFPMEEGLFNFYDSVRDDFDSLEKGEPYAITIDGVEGLAMDVTGVYSGIDVHGQMAFVNPRDTSFFFAFGIGMVYEDINYWEAEGTSVFNNIVSSVEFLPLELLEGSCEISTDETYGYDQENPIKVGVRDMVDALDFIAQLDGAIRQHVYLETLLGPGGQTISFEREGSIGVGDVILDVYHVTYAGLDTPITLYIDIYHFEEPKAPVGFTCERPFPLE